MAALHDTVSAVHHWLPALYLASAALELAGVGLVVRQLAAARRLWRTHSEAVAQEHQAMRDDLRYRLDPLNTRYGVTPGEIKRSTAAVESLMAFDPREQALTVLFLLGGILVGLAANLASLA